MALLSDALRALMPVLEALAQEAEARESQAQTGDPWMTPRQVGVALGVHVSTVCKLFRTGALGPVVRWGKHPRIRRSSLERFMAAQEKTA